MSRRRWLIACGLLMLALPRTAAARSSVLIITPESAHAPGAVALIDAIRAELRRDAAEAPDILVESLDGARYPSDEYERQLAALFRARYVDAHINLVIALGEPSLDFADRYRPQLFADATILFGLIDARIIAGRALGPRVTGVLVNADVRGTLQLALALHPAARRVVIIGGTSRFDRGWEDLAVVETRRWRGPVAFTYLTDRPLNEVLGRLALLGPDAIVLRIEMMSDASESVVVPPHSVTALVRQVTGVPVYGISSSDLGSGIVGGVLVDLDRHGASLGRRARQLLDAGPRADATPATTDNVTAFDARELKRFGISEAALPGGAVIRMREPGTWARFRTPILTGTILGTIGLVLLAALFVQTRQRRRLDSSLRRRREFESVLGDVLIATAKSGTTREQHLLDATLRRVADAVGVDDVWLWQFGDPSDLAWTSLRLKCGEKVAFAGIDELPLGLQRRLRERGITPASILATPVTDGVTSYGALFWISSQPQSEWSLVQLDRFRVFGLMFAHDLQRVDAQRALEEGNALKSAILASLLANIVVLDRNGIVIAINETWTDWQRRGSAGEIIQRGVSYFLACERAAKDGCAPAADALVGMRDVCAGKRDQFDLEYPLMQADGERWFHVKVVALKRDEGGAVITRTDITDRRRSETLIRENEDRFRKLADALPLGVWLSGVDGACTYVNRMWVDLTGRPPERAFGVGWLEAVHPDDRERCMGIYLRAFAARQPFSMEYRVRRFDGEYRWLLDKGIPRYDVDTTFLGYVGGAIDFTDQRKAEDALRDVGGKLIAAQEDERRRIARDLHDNVCQRMALLAMRLEDLQRGLPPASEASGAVAAMHEDIQAIARDLHSVSHQLHSAALEALGLVDAVASHCREVSDHGVQVQFSHTAVPTVPSDAALCVFRVVQEALANIVKHSGTTTARVTMIGATDTILLRVEDGGCGFVPTHAAEGLGLVSMRERVRSAGGELSIRSMPGQGTAIEARVPIHHAGTPSGDTTELSLPFDTCPPLSVLLERSESSTG